MFKVYNLEEFLNNSNFIYLVGRIYEFSKFLGNIYPNYDSWFFDIHLEGIGNGRTTLFVVNDKKEIVGICNLKNRDNEKKICSLYVDDKYKEFGIDIMLLKKAFLYLNTTKPLITFHLDKYSFYKGIIEEFEWKLRQINYDGELCYNGTQWKRKIK